MELPREQLQLLCGLVLQTDALPGITKNNDRDHASRSHQSGLINFMRTCGSVPKIWEYHNPFG